MLLKEANSFLIFQGVAGWEMVLEAAAEARGRQSVKKVGYCTFNLFAIRAAQERALASA